MSLTCTPAEFHRLVDTNLTGFFVFCQAAYGAMKAGRGGRTINIGSMVSLFGVPFAAPHAATIGRIRCRDFICGHLCRVLL